MTSYMRRTYEPFKFLGRFFWVPLHVLPGTPAVSVAPTWEDTGERWSPTYVVRIPLTRTAIGFGYWRDIDPQQIVVVHSDDAEYDLYCAVNGPTSRDKWDSARAEIAEMGLDPDDEMALMQERGIFE